MKKINKLISLLLVMVTFITLVACSGGAGVKGIMEAKATTNKATITCTFEANSKLESGDAYPIIRQYSYENGTVKDTSDTYKKVTFDKSNTVATVEFDGLESNTKYLYRMYINYESTDTFLTEIEVTTLSYDDEKPIEISSKDDFKNMTDDNDGIYVLNNDIDFDNEELSLFSAESEPFNGTFNGNGHTIKNVKLSKTALSFYGLFGYTKNAKISNFTLENVTVESSNLGSFSAGALIGKAESTTVSDVTIKNVNYTVSVNSTGDLNVGGVVGVSDKSTFTKVKAENVSIDFSQVRYKVNVGLFAGEISGDSIGEATIDGKTKKVVTNECMVSGKLKGDMKFTSTTEGYLRASGFVGFVKSSSSVIYNSYTDSTIILTKSDSVDKFDLSVGGFLGSNSGYVNISKCFAKCDIQVSAGDYVTSETSAEDIDTINANQLVANDSDKTAAVGGFAGRLNKTIGKISDCYFIGNVKTYALNTRKASDSERTKFEAKTNNKISSLAVGTKEVVDGITYEITDETVYYVKDNDNYVVATDVDPDNFPTNKYYVLNGEAYELASTYTPKVLTATYLVVGDIYGFTNYQPAPTLYNVAKYQASSDTSSFEEFVKNFINTIDL